jgi:hypothetical protein
MDMKMQSTKKNLLVYIIESLEKDNIEVIIYFIIHKNKSTCKI